LRGLTLIFFLLLTILTVRPQDKMPADSRYLPYQNLLELNDDSVKCANLITYASKITDSLNDYNFALLIFEKANSILHQNRDKPNAYRTLKPLLYSNWAYCLYLKGDFDAASKLYSNALGFTDILASKPQLKADILNRAGINLQLLTAYKKALLYYNDALELYTKLNDDEGKAIVYSNMAALFAINDNHAEADKFADKSAEIFLQNRNMGKYATALVNKANLKARMGKNEEAKLILLKVLRIIPGDNVEVYIVTCFNTGVIYGEFKQWDSSYYFLNKAKTIADSAHLSEQFNSQYYWNLGSIYGKQNETAKAIACYKLAIKNNNSISNYKNLHDEISDLYFKQKQYDSALIYKNAGMRITDSIYKSELDEHIRFENKRIELLDKDYQNQIKATQQQSFLNDLQKRNFVLLGAVAVLIAFVLLLLLYFKQYKLRVKKEQLQSELDFLKAQLNPHFLFNSLNNIYVLLDQDKSKAASLLMQFCELMRYQLYDCAVSYIPLSEELKFLGNYVDFEKLRYEGKISIEHNFAEPVTGDLQIAPILLQPFIENAFKHTPKNRRDPGQISICVELTGAHFFMEVKNPVSLQEQPALPGGIGLGNVKKRLKLLYPGKHELKINAAETYFQIRLKITL
jgi:tetratricopeptide (TPR) repeat protein